jgi:hypothetical protein
MKLKYLIVVFLLSACSTTPEQPTPFEPKEITSPPSGCIELRKQGGDC